MKYRTVTERVGEYLGPIDWSFDFDKDNTVGRSEKWTAELKENLRLLEADPDAYEATTDGGSPKFGWGEVLQVGMYDGWPYWRPHPSVLLASWAGASWHSYSAICAIRKRVAPTPAGGASGEGRP